MTPKPRRQIALRLGADEQQAIIDAYVSGSPTTMLCRHHKISKSAVLKLLADAGLTMRRQPLGHAQVVEAARLYRDGQSLSQVAERLNLAQSSLQAALVRAGVRLRPQTGG